MSRKMSAYGRKRHRVDPLGGLRLISEVTPFDQSEQLSLALPPRIAFESIRGGRGSDGDFDTLAAVVNVALVLCEQIGQQGVDLCQEAQEALLVVKARHQTTGRWGFDYRALQSIPSAIELHEQLLALCTPKQMMDAMREVVRRMSAGHVHEVAA